MVFTMITGENGGFTIGFTIGFHWFHSSGGVFWALALEIRFHERAQGPGETREKNCISSID